MSGYEAAVKIYTTAAELPSTAFEGTLSYAQDTNTLYIWNGTRWVPSAGGSGSLLSVVKSAGESVTNNTMQNDDHLLLPLAASTNYAFELMIQYGTTATADFKCDFTFSGSSSAYREWAYWTTVGGTSITTQAPHTTIGTDTVILHGATGEAALVIRGAIAVADAGTLQFRWAQNTTDAVATTVRLGGVLRAWSNP